MGIHASDSEGLRAFNCGHLGELGGRYGGLVRLLLILVLRCMVHIVLGWERRRKRGRGWLGVEATDESLIHGSDILNRPRKCSRASVSLIFLGDCEIKVV